MQRIARFCLIFLLSTNTFAKASEEKSASSMQSLRKELAHLQLEKVKLFKQQTELSEQLSILSEQILHLDHEFITKKKNIQSNKKNIEKLSPTLIRLARLNSLCILVQPKKSHNIVQGQILIRSLTQSLKQKLIANQALLQELSKLEKEIKHQKNTHLLMAKDLTIKRQELDNIEKQKLTTWQERHVDELNQKDWDINELVRESHKLIQAPLENDSLNKIPPSLRIEQPVGGKIVNNCNLQKTFNAKNEGIVFETKMNAKVYAPADGKVVFIGPFQGQGDIIIIDHGKKIHTILIGMHKISAQTGQNVYVGNELGSMAGHGKEKQYLYLELRARGKAVNPTPYLFNNS